MFMIGVGFSCKSGKGHHRCATGQVFLYYVVLSHGRRLYDSHLVWRRALHQGQHDPAAIPAVSDEEGRLLALLAMHQELPREPAVSNLAAGTPFKAIDSRVLVSILLLLLLRLLSVALLGSRLLWSVG